MLRYLQRRLFMIRYYSAPRQRTAWTTAMDIALAATLMLAVPFVWIADLTVRTPPIPTLTSFEVSRDAAGGFHARLIGADEAITTSSDEFSEVVMVTGQRIERGFPMRTTIRELPVELDFEVGSAIEGELKDAAVRDALLEAISAAAGPDHAPAGIERVTRRWPAWFVNGLFWWVVLWFMASVSIRLAEYFWAIGSSVRRSRRAARRAQNLCAHCGYDLRGLEFNERCPECGELV